ncbi:alpha-ketoglutarate-dependent dioxygenase alkB homolog 7, mitochondrial isoform X3 [Columba livia]|uniref:alpha-ketoglutarate-dependent dioxygenase alkB homolog 7, mitochondrial isoform X3 n=1 Tax=Columba livia TaxID=8932 RepID=UPI0031BB5EEE
MMPRAESSSAPGGAALPACTARAACGGAGREAGPGTGPGGRAGPGRGPGDGPGGDPGGGPGGLGPDGRADPGLVRASSPAVERRLRGLALVRGGFVSAAEAAELLAELEPLLGRRPYQFDHWDGAISGYRETERALRGGAGRALLRRVAAAFPATRPPLPLVHVLDLHARGHVRPHVDSVKPPPWTLPAPPLLKLKSPPRTPNKWRRPRPPGAAATAAPRPGTSRPQSESGDNTTPPGPPPGPPHGSTGAEEPTHGY